MSVFYLMDSAEPLPLWDRGLEGNPHLLVNINARLGFGWLLWLVLGSRERHLSLVLLEEKRHGFALDIFFVSSLNSVEKHLLEPLDH